MSGTGTAGTAGRGYRPEIDGLRTLAVVPVVAFHAGMTGLGGGYVGVDIFFVISGFLITSILAREIDEGRFSILRFYERRVRRIMPALFVMLAAVMVVAALLFLPRNFVAVQRSVLATLAFVSNFLFWSEVDYFGTPGRLKPLLHTWSLAVEEQYYLFFPPFLMLAARYARRWLVPMVWVATLGSLALAIVAVKIFDGFAFYMLPPRMWELLVGSLLALNAVPQLRSRTGRSILSTAGFVAIAAAMLFYTEKTPFPGLAALPPVLGAAAIIHGGGDTLIGRLLSLRPMVLIGLISYSLYLWHWPIIVFSAYYWPGIGGPAYIAAVVLASVAAATVSWRYVERPFRLGRHEAGHMTQGRIFAFAGAGAAVIAGISAVALLSGGWSSRFTPAELALAAAVDDSSPRRKECHARTDRPSPGCRYGAATEPQMALWGDSHGVELSYALAPIAEANGVAFQQFTFSGCNPVADTASTACARLNRETIAYLERTPAIRTIIWVGYLDNESGHTPRKIAQVKATLTRLAATGKRIVVVYPVPQQPANVPMALATLARRGADLAAFGTTRAEYLRRNAGMLAMLDALPMPNLLRVRSYDLLCDAQRCRTVQGGKPLYFDQHHLSLAGARDLAEAFRPLPMWEAAAR